MKITIYLPSELRAAMDKHPGVNWSAIAQDAFAARCGGHVHHISAATFRQTLTEAGNGLGTHRNFRRKEQV